MADVLKGEVRSCDFGPWEGHELSGLRCGLVLSDGGYNRRFGQAVVAPVTGSRPVPPHRWHIPIGPDCAWAVVKQLRTVAVSRLKGVRFTASLCQMDDVDHAVSRLLGEPPGSADGINSGGVYEARIPGLSAGEYDGFVMVLDYSAGNRMAIVMVVFDGQKDGSFTVPFRLDGDARSWVVCANQVRTVSMCRLGERLGLAGLDVTNRARSIFSSIVSGGSGPV